MNNKIRRAVGNNMWSKVNDDWFAYDGAWEKARPDKNDKGFKDFTNNMVSLKPHEYVYKMSVSPTENTKITDRFGGEIGLLKNFGRFKKTATAKISRFRKNASRILEYELMRPDDRQCWIPCDEPAESWILLLPLGLKVKQLMKINY